jgi:hypothetical protein
MHHLVLRHQEHPYKEEEAWSREVIIHFRKVPLLLSSRIVGESGEQPL